MNWRLPRVAASDSAQHRTLSRSIVTKCRGGAQLSLMLVASNVRVRQRCAFAALIALFAWAGRPGAVEAADPEPENASIMSATATLLPVAAGALLLSTGRREAEGVRFTSALTSISVGAILGPTTGQLYAGAGVDAAVTFFLRSLTGGLAVTGLALSLRGTEDDEAPAAALMALGGIPTLILAIYDIVDAGNTAREARIRRAMTPNRRHELDELYSVAVCGPFPCAAGFRE